VNADTCEGGTADIEEEEKKKKGKGEKLTVVHCYGIRTNARGRGLGGGKGRPPSETWTSPPAILFSCPTQRLGAVDEGRKKKEEPLKKTTPATRNCPRRAGLKAAELRETE